MEKKPAKPLKEGYERGQAKSPSNTPKPAAPPPPKPKSK